MNSVIILGVIVILLYGRFLYWKGYQKGYDNAKDIYDETCGLEEFEERLNEDR